jgi:hypothetical protein
MFSENRVLRGIFGSKTDGARKAWENCMMRSFIICTLHLILLEWSCQGRWDGWSTEENRIEHKILVEKSERESSTLLLVRSLVSIPPILNEEEARSFETSVNVYQTTRRHGSDHSTVHIVNILLFSKGLWQQLIHNMGHIWYRRLSGRWVRLRHQI